jgi:ATP-dependent DNA helicase RecQ
MLGRMNDTLPAELSPTALAAELKQRFGFDSFRPGQQEVMCDILGERDVLAIMPTGGGKSLCFQLPALLRPGVCIVVSPLIALMQDQVRLLQNNGIEATFINSSLERVENSRRLARLERGEFKLPVRGSRAVTAIRVPRRSATAASGRARHFFSGRR